MPRKSTGPYLGPPSWLSQSAERSLELSYTYPTKAAFVGECMSSLLSTLDPRRAAEIASNAVLETGWGKSCYWNNAGGWKINSSYAKSYRKRYGKEPEWWKARGNVDSGDPDWCFYRVFPSLDTFFAEWVERFIPRPGTVGNEHRYKKTGEVWWSGNPYGDRHWFGELILAGYKGRIRTRELETIRSNGTKDSTHKSVSGHVTLVQDVLEIWAQLRLGIDPDGAWGPKSIARCKQFQTNHNLPATGNLDDPTLTAMVAFS